MNLAASPALLAAESVSGTRGSATLFRGIDLAVPAGRALLLRGRNGTGKTTLLRILAGLTTPSAGTVRFCGRDVREVARDFRAALLFLGHLPAINDLLTARENLQHWLALDGEEPKAVDLDGALERVGLSARRTVPARSLSAGQRRRIGLARALLARRSVWLLDEPTTALDAAGVDLLHTTLSGHLDGGGVAVIATHQDLALAAHQRSELVLG